MRSASADLAPSIGKFVRVRWSSAGSVWFNSFFLQDCNQRRGKIPLSLSRQSFSHCKSQVLSCLSWPTCIFLSISRYLSLSIYSSVPTLLNNGTGMRSAPLNSFHLMLCLLALLTHACRVQHTWEATWCRGLTLHVLPAWQLLRGRSAWGDGRPSRRQKSG